MWRDSPLASKLLVPAMVLVVAGCRNPGAWSEMVRSNEELRREKDRLQRELTQREQTTAQLQEQVETLKGFEEDRPLDLFAPASIELVKLTGGRDYDGQPGDDGVTVYLRPRDAAGDVVKAPGRITIQLLDNSDLANPRVIAICKFDDPEQLKETWHGKFLTNHYSLDCPFPPDAELPDSGKLVVTVTFTDFLTGKGLNASKEVTYSRKGAEAAQVGATP